MWSTSMNTKLNGSAAPAGGGANRPVDEPIMRLCDMTPELYAQIKERLGEELEEQVSTFAEAN